MKHGSRWQFPVFIAALRLQYINFLTYRDYPLFRLKSCGMLCIVLIIFAMLTSWQSPKAVELSSHKVTDDFLCEKMAVATAPYACSLRPNKAFLGVRVGMDYKDAFLALKQSAGDSVWVSYTSKTNPRISSPKKAGIDDHDWSVFQRTDRWMLRDVGYPCVNYRYIFLNVGDRRVDNLDVHCDKLRGLPQGIYKLQ